MTTTPARHPHVVDAARAGARAEFDPAAGVHAVVLGSLGKGNFGDEMLIRSFLRAQGPNLAGATVLAEGPTLVTDPRVGRVRVPPQALGRRFWSGRSRRAEAAREVRDRAAGRACVLAWLGGLFGSATLNNRVRHRELLWSRGFCRGRVYYFGDAADGFATDPAARPLVRTLDRLGAWVAVRSPEAAEELVAAGLRATPRIGIDIVLRDLAAARGLPFRRRAEASGTLVISPCAVDAVRHRPTWVAAAREGARLGLRIRWLSFADAEDLNLCRLMADELAAERPGHPQEVRVPTLQDAGTADADACVASRFHAAIFALADGVPTIVVAYDPKLSRLHRTLGLGDWVAPVAAGSGGDGRHAGAVAEMVRGAVAGAPRPSFDELARRIEAHRRAEDDLRGYLAALPCPTARRR